MKNNIFFSTLLLAFLVAFANTGNAQAPGFQGKRFAIGVMTSPSVYYDQFSALYEYYSGSSRIKLSFKHSLSFAFAAGRSTTIAANIGFARQNYNFGLTFDGPYSEQYGTYQAYYYTGSDPLKSYTESRIKTNMLTLGVSIRKYTGAFIAPIGKYLELGIGQVRLNVKTENDSLPYFYYNYDFRNNASLVLPEKVFRATYISIRSGNNVPLKHNFALDYSFGMSLFFNGSYKETYSNLIPSQTPIAELSYNSFFNILGKNLRRQNLLDLRIGLSYLF